MKIKLLFLFLLVSLITFAKNSKLWVTSVEEAIKIAGKSNKDILVDFTGSDWCGWCIRLDKEVFSTEKWDKEASKKFVFVEIDFPQKKQLSPEQKEYNAKLQSEYQVQGYPTIILLDSKGKPYAITGFQEGGVDNYLKHLDSLSLRKKEKDDSLSKIKTSKKNEEKIKILDDLINKLNSWEIAKFYPELKEQIIALDNDNKFGFKSKYLAEITLFYYEKNDANKYDEYFTELKKVDEKKANGIITKIELSQIYNNDIVYKRWKEANEKLEKLIAQNPEGDVGQEIYFYLGIIQYYLTNIDKCIEYFEKAISLSPDSQLVSVIEENMSFVKEEKNKNKK
ncbi:MAG: hypothetical protein A2086_05285 [Spirochaetes bacterium GWD1_27_9]|nr:MAG: hypothetical protein A2Z98_04945 [Spirochaetes bacterium GWB1_27_13]OHD24659.1 MAG: hypothetical protein A2Y34_03355 [Spirochaetes bacterium GWC1_27_15]OHD45036.1 MAG: hypothetical protein A2086_05285 [Spirochaetes bacterium GWD1_27_9]